MYTSTEQSEEPKEFNIEGNLENLFKRQEEMGRNFTDATQN